MSIDLIAGPVAAKRLREMKASATLPGIPEDMVSCDLYAAFRGHLAASVEKFPQLDAEGFYRRAFEILKPAFSGANSPLDRFEDFNAMSAQGIRENLHQIAAYAADCKAFGEKVGIVYRWEVADINRRILPDDE